MKKKWGGNRREKVYSEIWRNAVSGMGGGGVGGAFGFHEIQTGGWPREGSVARGKDKNHQKMAIKYLP